MRVRSLRAYVCVCACFGGKDRASLLAVCVCVCVFGWEGLTPRCLWVGGGGVRACSYS
ncbi:MAG: hypothetical protein P4L40_22760 [Terracidiphilus sp.]|nr:hypothetical protein [Terracidiphilus sp.]